VRGWISRLRPRSFVLVCMSELEVVLQALMSCLGYQSAVRPRNQSQRTEQIQECAFSLSWYWQCWEGSRSEETPLEPCLGDDRNAVVVPHSMRHQRAAEQLAGSGKL
jgi:hypothetical protein